MTNGVTATLNTAPNGEFLGIRVEWSIKSEYSQVNCQFTTLRVELNDNEVGKDINISNRVADLFGDHLQCNKKYTPRVRAIFSQTVKMDYGAPLYYGGDDV